jgi:hypothetical protein
MLGVDAPLGGRRCLQTLEEAHALLPDWSPVSSVHIYIRNACRFQALDATYGHHRVHYLVHGGYVGLRMLSRVMARLFRKIVGSQYYGSVGLGLLFEELT